MKRLTYLCLCCIVSSAAATSAAPMYHLTTLAKFNGANGSYPYAGLIADASGNLFGTTYDGGANNAGTVFELAAVTHSLSTLVTFNFTNGGLSRCWPDRRCQRQPLRHDGRRRGEQPGHSVRAGCRHTRPQHAGHVQWRERRDPEAGLIADASGNLFGTTYKGGVNGNGTVYEVAAGTHELSTLASFNSTNGAYPQAGLLSDASGNLYGTTYQGGAFNVGTVFEVANDVNHTLSTLATFNGLNGANPYAGLMADASGNLYGTTVGGGANNRGTVFEVAAGSSSITTLATFNGVNGQFPQAGLLADAGGNMFGTT